MADLPRPTLEDLDQAGDAPPSPELLAEAVEELRRLPRSPAIGAAIRHLEAEPWVPGILRRRRGLRLFDELWASGECWTRLDAEEAVARRLGVGVSTVRGWRWERDVFREPNSQQAAGDGEATEKEP